MLNKSTNSDRFISIYENVLNLHVIASPKDCENHPFCWRRAMFLFQQIDDILASLGGSAIAEEDIWRASNSEFSSSASLVDILYWPWDDPMMESVRYPVWQYSRSKRTKSGAGMTAKGVAKYRRQNPGSKLKTAVTEKNPKGKRAARRKSFCARSAGQMKKFPKAAKNPNSRLRQARRRWRC